MEWLWEVRERKRQMDRFSNYRKLQKIVKDRSIPSLYALQEKWQVENFLRYGEIGLTTRQIARIKDEKMRKMRVSIYFAA